MPIPTLCAVFASPSGASCGARDANAVLHDFAKSTRNGTLPSSMSWEFLNVRPSTTRFFGHGTTVSPVVPLSSTPSAVIVLNVEPGGVCPVRAKLLPAAPGPLATATSVLSLTRIATRADPAGVEGEGRLGRVLDVDVEGDLDRRSRRRFGGEELLVRCTGGHGHHDGDARLALQGRVVLLLQPGQADDVADLVLAGVLVHDLLRHLAGRADQGTGELGGGPRVCVELRVTTPGVELSLLATWS